MRRRPAPDPHATEVARRRLEALSRELGLEGARPKGDRSEERSRDHSTDPWPVDQELDDELVALTWSPPPDRRLGRADSTATGRDSQPSGWSTAGARGRDEPAWDDAAVGDRLPGASAPRLPGRHALPRLSWRERWGLWVEERSSGGARQFGAAHLAVVALLVAVSLAVGAWHTLRGSVEEAPVAAPTLSEPPGEDPGSVEAPGPGAGPTAEGATTAPTAPAAAGAATVGTAAAEVVVDVVGKVRRPGIAVLPAGSRVVDALKAAGGARPGVGTDSLNLARPLTDGEQIVVGRSAALTAPPAGASAGPPSTAASPTALVNLNTADQVALETLPGVGPVTAAAILQWRTENGGFTAVEELLEVSGIGDATLAQIAPNVTI